MISSALKAWIGIVAGAFLVLSSAAHSVLGWRALQAELAGTNVPADLAFSLEAGWHFAGVAMLAFGVQTVGIFRQRLAGRQTPTWPVTVAGIVYATYGIWATWASGFHLFFLVFLVPGLALIAAASGTSEPQGGASSSS
jgi:hypothetical protein